jgi:putative spermidine/putrescine transport system permease protein
VPQRREDARRPRRPTLASTIFLITLPLIWQGVLSGWLFAFVVSFGELNTALFLSGPGLTTLPIEIFSYL